MKTKNRVSKKTAIIRRVGIGRIIAICIVLTGTAYMLALLPRILTVAQTEILLPEAITDTSTWTDASLDQFIDKDDLAASTTSPDASLSATLAPSTMCDGEIESLTVRAWAYSDHPTAKFVLGLEGQAVGTPEEPSHDETAFSEHTLEIPTKSNGTAWTCEDLSGLVVNITSFQENSEDSEPVTTTWKVDSIWVEVTHVQAEPELNLRSYRWQYSPEEVVEDLIPETPISSVAPGEQVALRVQVDNTGGFDAIHQRFLLQYSEKGTQDCRDITEWYDFNDQSAFTYSELSSVGIGEFQTSSKGQCGISGCDGTVSGSWSTERSYVDIPPDYAAEMGFTIDTLNATSGTTYCLRVVTEDESTGSSQILSGKYTTFPEISIRQDQQVKVLKELKSNKKPKIKASKEHFSYEESPSFEVDFFEATDISTPYIDGIIKEKRVIRQGNFQIAANLRNHNGTLSKVVPTVTLLPDGHIYVDIPNPEAFRPGRYTLEITAEEKDYATFEVEQDFTWGVLAVNTNRSIYTPGQDAEFLMTVLDNGGFTVCDAEVSLSITSPSGAVTSMSTKAGTIEVSGDCAPNSITYVPDYSATMKNLAETGTYTMNMTATYANGTRSITDLFEARSSVDFDVERIGPVRINPVEPYTMKLKITPQNNYSGTVQEETPDIYTVSGEGFSQGTRNGRRVLTWDVDWKAGETYELTYSFDAPDVYPEFHLLGPLTIGSFEEARLWHVAVDGVGDLILLWDDSYGSVPSGWSSLSGTSGTYENMFIRGAATAGGTGGFLEHTHTASVNVTDFTADAKKGKGTNISATHGHTGSITDGLAGSNLPEYSTLIVIQYSGVPSTLPANIIALFDAAPDSNWAQYAVQNGYYIRGSSSAGTTGGNTNNQHSHSLSISLAPDTGSTNPAGDSSGDAASYGHTHTASGTSDTQTYQPPYREVMLYRNNSGGDISIPVGMIGMFDEAAPTGWSSISGSGGAFENIFPKPSSSYGSSTAGGGTHSHADITGITSSLSSDTLSPGHDGTGFSMVCTVHTHPVTVTGFSTIAEADNLPPYVDTVLAKKLPAAITIEGDCLDYDQVSSCPDSQTVRVVVGTSLQTETDTTSSGSWSITDVTAPESGDIITVYLETVGDSNEAVAVTQYDGDGDISSVHLYEEHLTIGSGDNQTLTNAELSTWDYSASGNNEDIFFDVDGSNILTVDATSQSSQEELYISANNTHAPEAQVNTHDIEIDGTLTGGSAAIKVSGSWDNDNVFTAGTSAVTMTAASGSETIDSTGSSTSLFNTLTLGESSGSAEWTLGYALDVNGVLTIDYGTLIQSTYDVTLESDLSIGASGNFTSGAGSVTFDGSGSSTWTNAATIDDIGDVIIEGSSKTINLGSSVKATSVEVGADDVIGLGSSGYTLSLSGSGAGASRPFIVNNASGLTEGANSTVSYEGTTDVDVEDETYYNLTLAPSGGAGPTYTLNAGTYGMQNLTIGDGSNSVTVTADTNDPTLPISGNFTVNNGGTFTASATASITLVGDLTLNATSTYNNSGSSGTFTFNKAGTQTWTDNNATLQDIGTVIIDGSATTVALGGDASATKITVGVNDVLNLGSSGYELIITGSGTTTSRPLIINNTSGLVEGTDSTVTYTGITDTDIEDETYWNLNLTPNGGSNPTYTLNSGSFNSNNLTLGDGIYSVTVDADTNDPSLNVSGNLLINDGATYTGSASSSFTFDGTSTGTWTDNNATKQNIGLVTINGTTKVVNLATSAKATKVTIETDDTLGLGSSGYTLEITGSGSGASRPFVVKTGGTLNEGTNSTILHSAGAALDVQEETYYNLTLAPSGTSATYTLATASSRNINVTGALTIGDDSTAVIIDGYTYYPTLDAGSLVLHTGSAITLNHAGSWTFSSNVDLTGTTYNTEGGIVSSLYLDGTGVSLTTGGIQLEDLHLTGDVTLANETITVKNSLYMPGSVTPGSSTINMSIVDGTGILSGGGNTLTNLTISRDAAAGTISTASGSTVYVTGTLTVGDADILTIGGGGTGWVYYSGSSFTITGATINGSSGTLVFLPSSSGPGSDGTISSIVRYDASGGDIGNTTIDARTYGGMVEIFSDDSAGAPRNVTLAAGAYTISGASSHLHIINDSNTYTLTLDASAATSVSIGGDLDFTGAGSSSEIITSGAGTWTVGGNVNFTDGTYTATAGNTLEMNGTTKSITSASTTLQNFEVSGGSISNADVMDVNGTFTVSAGAFAHTTGNMSVAGDFTLASGTTFTQPGACDPTCDYTLTFDGDLSYADNTAEPGQSIGDVIIGQSPDTTILTTDMSANSLTVTGADLYYTCEYDLDIGNSGVEISGTFDASASGSGNCSANEGDETTINTAEDFNINSGATFVQDQSTVIFDDPSGTDTLITDGSYSLYNLTLNGGTGMTIQVQDPLDVDNDVTITQGTLDTVSGEDNDINVGGSWDNNYAFTANNAEVIFDSADTGETIEAGSSSFYDISFNNSGGGWTIQTDNLTATHNFTITDTAASGFTVNSVTVEVNGTYSCADAEFSNTTWTSATLYLNSASAYTVGSKTQNAETYSTLQIGANTDIRTWESNASVATTVDSTGSLYSQDHANTSGDLYIWGDYHTQTNDYWSYATDFDGVAATRQVDVRIDPSAKVTVDASDTLAAIGTGANRTTVSRQGASNGYELSCLSTGTINFQYTDFDYLDGALGIDIQAGCVVTSLDYTDYDNLVGTAGTADAFITLPSSVIGSGSKTLTGMNFDNTGTGAEFNVNRTGADDTGDWTFTGHGGAFDGESYDGKDGVNEADPGMLIWDDSTVGTAPNDPTTLAQKQTDDTVIVVADWTDETSVKFTAQASDTDNPDTLYLCIEADQLGTAFSDTEDSCGSGVAYSGSPVEVTHTLTGLTQGYEYHWQARIKDSAALYSNWVSYSTNAEDERDFGIDNTAPGTGNVYDGSTIIGTDLDENDGTLDIIEANWANITDAESNIKGYEYAIGTTAGGTDILTWTSKTEPGNLFSDGFESADLSGWDANSNDSGDLAANEDAEYIGLYGAAALIDDGNSIYVQDNFTAAGTYYARFYINPNNLTMSSGDTFTLMDARSSTTIRASVELYYNGSNYQVRGVLETGPQVTSWVTIGATAWTSVELRWFADASGYVSLWVDGTQYDTATGDTSSTTVDNVQLGMVSDWDSGTSGTFYFDQFTSDNTDYNGPFTYFTETIVTAGHLHTGQDYYVTVRATNNSELTGNATNSDGIIVLPTFTFTVDSSSINFLNLNEGNSWTDTKTTTTTASTNAYGGYIATIWNNQLLTNTISPSNTISAYAGTNSVPTVWTGTGFGYTTNDDNLSGGTADRFTNGGPKYAGFITTGEGEPVADHTTAITGQTGAVSSQQFTITYRVTTSSSQAAGPYSNEIIIVATPTF